MSRSIPEVLAALALGEGTVLGGVRVQRCSLFGFRVDGAAAILDAPSVAARVAAATPRKNATGRARAGHPPPRIEVCFRCAGDGLGRRDRGVCAVCHGEGIRAGEPAGGWSTAKPGELTAAVEQATLALRSACHPRARERLTALLSTLAALGGRPVGDLRRALAEPAPKPLATPRTSRGPGANAA